MTVDLIDKVKKYPLTVGSTVLDIVTVKKIAFKYRSVMSKCPCSSGNILSLPGKESVLILNLIPSNKVGSLQAGVLMYFSNLWW